MKIFVSNLRKLFILSILLISALSIAFASQAVVWAQEAQENQVAGQEYTMPYAGLLPDSPLYPLKKMRDSVWVFFTRDNVKKADVLLLISDKKIVMAQAMADKGKWGSALKVAQDSEKDVSQDVYKRQGYTHRINAKKTVTNV